MRAVSAKKSKKAEPAYLEFPNSRCPLNFATAAVKNRAPRS
nr:hypothetical protein [uncultured Campylobacter sp.]